MAAHANAPVVLLFLWTTVPYLTGAELCVDQDDDARVAAWVDVNFVDGDGIEGGPGVTSCGAALEATRGLLCADLNG